MSKPTKIGVGVGVAVFKKGKLLLGLRHPDKDKASSELQGQGTWTMPGGKVDPGETLIVAAKRELQEETLIEGGDAMEFVCVHDDILGEAHYVTVGFRLDVGEAIQPVAAEPETIIEWNWFGLDELPENVYFPSRKLLKSIQDGSVYS